MSTIGTALRRHLDISFGQGFKSMLFQLARNCEGTILFNAIAKYGNNAMLVQWTLLKQKLEINRKMLRTIISRGDSHLTRILLSRRETLHLEGVGSAETIISTKDAVVPPYLSSGDPPLESTCIQSLLKRPETIVIPNYLVGRLIMERDVNTTQLLLRRKENISTINEVIEELLAPRSRQVRDLLFKTLLQPLKPKIEYSFIFLVLGDSTKMDDLLR